MSRKSIRLDILKQVIADASPLFATKDVSEDERVRRAHPALAAHRNYHAFVGGALSDHHVALNIIEVRKSTPRGSEWLADDVPAEVVQDLTKLDESIPGMVPWSWVRQSAGVRTPQWAEDFFAGLSRAE
jgi:hypothetical protein